MNQISELAETLHISTSNEQITTLSHTQRCNGYLIRWDLRLVLTIKGTAGDE